MIPEKIEKLFANAKPLEIPKIHQVITKSCSNCMDYIVCWAYGKIEETEDEDKEEIQNKQRAKDCNDWHLDFMKYQELIKESEDNL